MPYPRSVPRIPPARARALGVLRNTVLGPDGIPLDTTRSTLVASPVTFTGNGIATSTVTLNAVDDDGVSLAVSGVTFTAVNEEVSASLSSVTAFPTTIDDDGVDASTIGVYIVDAAGDPVVGVPAASVSVTSTGVNNTIAAIDAVSDYTGLIRFSLKSTTAEAKTVSATVWGRAITDTATVTVTSVYVTPNIVNNASFETTWDSFTDATYVSDPDANSPLTIARSTEQAFAGTTSVKMTWAASATDKAANFYRSLGGNRDEVWVRTYFYLVAGWDITTIQKWCRFRNDSELFGGWFLNNSGLSWGFDAEASGVVSYIVPKVSIPTNQWNYVELHYRRNGDAQPNVALWLNGVPQYKANGADPAGFGLTWLDGRLYAGGRNSSSPMNRVMWVNTLNGGNTGSGTIYLDYIGISTAGRIGP